MHNRYCSTFQVPFITIKESIRYQLGATGHTAVYTLALYVETVISVTRLGDLLDFGQLFKAIGNN